jgi:hypothetical protein
MSLIKTLRANGEFDSSPSTYCPKCQHYEVDKVTVRESDFDENGWYFPIQLQCRNIECNHKWVEKAYPPITRLGFRH